MLQWNGLSAHDVVSCRVSAVENVSLMACTLNL